VRIALLEDDPVHSTTIAAWLREAGHDVHTYSSARDLKREVGRESFDVFLLDWMLPEQSGEEVLHWLREQRGESVPIIFITARKAEEDIVAALSAGADDYMVKPIRRAEMISRIAAVWRRSQPRSRDQDVVEHSPYRFEITAHRALRNGETIELTEKEFNLAVFLFRNLGRLLSRGHLLEAVWGRNASVATRTVDTHVSRVRSKLELRPENGFRLTPAYNYGYRLESLSADDEKA
jgi:DNA-binding response OmpR family regulator